MIFNTLTSDIQHLTPFVFQKDLLCSPKGFVLLSKRVRFALQKDSFCASKGLLFIFSGFGYENKALDIEKCIGCNISQKQNALQGEKALIVNAIPLAGRFAIIYLYSLHEYLQANNRMLS